MTTKEMINPKKSFMNHVSIDSPSGCWIWNDAKLKNGYGSVYAFGQTQTAHRLAYMIFKGEITEGLEVCHSCDNPPCCNPDHLWAGTHSENLIDITEKGRRRKKTHCPHGHEYTPENTLTRKKLNGFQIACRKCHNIRSQILYQNKTK